MNDFEYYRKKSNTVYEISFNGLNDIKEYLDSKPKINRCVFQHKMASVEGEYDFAGESYEKALSYLIDGYEKDYDTYLRLKKELISQYPIIDNKSRIVPSVAGSIPHIPNFIAGSPKAMYKIERTDSYKFVNINFNIDVCAYITRKQILSRGILTINLIKLLEDHGYRVNLNAFSLSQCEDEILYFKFILKRFGELLDARKCYYVFCSSEFFRRICFRLMEVSPVENYSWVPGYGRPINNSNAREFLNLSPLDILIGPSQIEDLSGNDINSDAKIFLKSLNIDQYIKPKR